MEQKSSPKNNKSSKRKVIISYDNLTPELVALLKDRYPLGYKEALKRIDKPNGDYFYAVLLSTEEAEYLVKMKVRVDANIDIDDIELESEEKVEVDDANLEDIDVADTDSDEG